MKKIIFALTAMMVLLVPSVLADTISVKGDGGTITHLRNDKYSDYISENMTIGITGISLDIKTNNNEIEDIFGYVFLATRTTDGNIVYALTSEFKEGRIWHNTKDKFAIDVDAEMLYVNQENGKETLTQRLRIYVNKETMKANILCIPFGFHIANTHLRTVEQN